MYVSLLPLDFLTFNEKTAIHAISRAYTTFENLPKEVLNLTLKTRELSKLLNIQTKRNEIYSHYLLCC